MKLRIEIDVDPSEFEVASQIIATLRELTEHVRINLQSVQNAPSVPFQPDRSRPPSSGPTPSQPKTSMAMPVASAARPKQPARQGLAPPPGMPDPSRPSGGPGQAAQSRADAAFFEAGFARFDSALLEDPSKKQQIAQQIIGALPTDLDSPEREAIFDAFLGVFEAALFRSDTMENTKTLDYCYLMPLVPAPLLDNLKKSVIQRAMKHLMIRRPLDANRMEFFAHAEAFAALVQLDFVLVPGAVQTISQLLKREECCIAAITMLGKTIELCCDKIKAECDEGKLTALQGLLEQANYEEIHYDKHYIMSQMGWTAPPKVPSIQEPNRVLPTASPINGSDYHSERRVPPLEPIAMWTDFTGQVRAVALDDEYCQVVTITSDGCLFLHNFDGGEIAKYSIKQRSYVDMDYNAKTRILVMSAMPAGSPPAEIHPVYMAYQLNKGNLQPLGRLAAHTETVSLNKLRYLSQGSDSFIAAETLTRARHVVTVYDSKSIQGTSGQLAPLQVIETDQQVITAMAVSPTNSSIFLTADKNGEIALWRAGMSPSMSVAKLLPPEDVASAGPNAAVVTCLEVVGDSLLVAGTYGQGINIWNLRELQKGTFRCSISIKLDEYPVTRLASFGDPQDRLCMVAAAKSIHTIELNEDGTLKDRVEGQKASDKFYWDAKWSSVQGYDLLFAASAAQTLDVYTTKHQDENTGQ